MASKEPDFRQVQRTFSAHLRDPANNPPPEGLDPERLEIYTDAVFANIEGLLADNFPLIRRYFGDEDWQSLVRDFLVQHRSDERLFIRYPLQFLEYLPSRTDLLEQFPFLCELADFEWRETDVCGDTAQIDLSGINPEGDLLADSPVLNPVHRVLQYHWRVHLVGTVEELVEPEAGECAVIVFRNPQQRFDCVELNPVTARLFELLQAEQQASGREQLTRIAWELKHPDAEAVIAGGLEILERMRGRGLILGTRAD